MSCNFLINQPFLIFKVILCAAVLLPQAGFAAAFADLGDLPGGLDFSEARAISTDGRVVVGFSKDSDGTAAIRWTAAEGVQMLPHWSTFGNSLHSEAEDVSADGSMIVGRSRIVDLQPDYRFLAAKWPAPDQVEIYSSSVDVVATTVSADSQTILGYAYSTPSLNSLVKFSDTGYAGFGLGTNNGFDYAAVAGVTADGTKVLARGRFKNTDTWTNYFYTFTTRTYEFIEEYRPTRFINVSAMSSDATYVVGSHNLQPGSISGKVFIWTSAGGFQDIGALPGDSVSFARSVTDDGQVVVGTSGAYRAAFIWTPANGLQNLQSVAENDFGLDLGGFIIRSATDVSNDGKKIVGWGETAQGNHHGFVLDFSDVFADGDLAPLGAPDGVINTADYLIALRISLGELTATSLELSHGDVYPPDAPDGVIDISDMLLIRAMVID